jgi:hypothetical protein
LILLALPPSSSGTGIRAEDFSSDPEWYGFGNRRVACRHVSQDFGYSPTNHAGSKRGEIGGLVSRSTKPAYYADPIQPVGLDDELTASGSIALVENSDGGVFVGWFNHGRQGWRPVNFLGFRLDEANVHVAYTTGTWRADGVKTQNALLMGQKTNWSISYDPAGNGGGGSICFSMKGVATTLNLLPGHREEGAVFDRFGIFNLQEPGGYQVVYLDDLRYGDEVEALTQDPDWDGSGNRITFRDCTLRGNQDFGYGNTSHARGNPGEIGGLIWRTEDPAYYADAAGILTLADELEASGNLVVTQASSDSGFLLGWFNSGDMGWPPWNFAGVVVEGPSRAGHYFRLMFCSSEGERLESEDNPIVYPNGTTYSWAISFDPETREFAGTLSTPNGSRDIALTVPQKERMEADRFGLLNLQVGGHEITAYLDDIAYTHGAGECEAMLLILVGLLAAHRLVTF